MYKPTTHRVLKNGLGFAMDHVEVTTKAKPGIACTQLLIAFVLCRLFAVMLLRP
jgi:hypothetical protein